jgi:phosphatidylserine/phosphatidylglycerophosphate/cardiolipin synthase-like enzyme
MRLINLGVGLLVGAAAYAAAEAAAPAAITPYFGSSVNVRNQLRLVLGGAEDEVVVVADRLTDYALADALLEAARRGRRVRVVLGAATGTLLVDRAIREHLQAGGVEVAVVDGDQPLYACFAVVDKRVVVTGSYPWVEEAAATPLAEFIVVDDATLAAAYLAFFDYIWTHAH